MPKKDKVTLFQWATENNPKLLLEWDFEENDKLGFDINVITYGSTKKAHWKCSVERCGHKWSAPPYSRTGNNSGCPECAKLKNPLSNYPDLVAELVDKTLDPSKIPAGSKDDLLWRCSTVGCGKEWLEPPVHRTRRGARPGCFMCLKLSKKVVSTPYKNKTCVICGDQYSPTSPKQKICLNPACYRKLKRSREKFLYKKKAPTYQKVCLVCSVSFLTRDSKMKYCGSLSCEKVRQINNSVLAESVRLQKRRAYRKEHPIEDPFVSTRANFEDVKKCFSDEGYTLLEENYKNNRTKMLVKCPKGHLWKTSFHNFKDAQNRCSFCVGGAVSRISQKWLDMKRIPEKYREAIIILDGKKFRVDAYTPKNKTVYEFDGDFFHGSPWKIRDFSTGVNGRNKKRFAELHLDTILKRILIRKEGYNLVHIWEKDFINFLK